MSDTRDDAKLIDAIYACGDEDGALHYANVRNKTLENDTPIIIEFEAPPSSVIIDGKDFLYPIFQGGDPSLCRPLLKKSFGESILDYAELAWNSSDQDYSIAQCDLAINDRNVIRSHYMNKIILGGRYRTRFRSAFSVSLPIKPKNIISVRLLDDVYQQIEEDVALFDLMQAR